MILKDMIFCLGKIFQNLVAFWNWSGKDTALGIFKLRIYVFVLFTNVAIPQGVKPFNLFRTEGTKLWSLGIFIVKCLVSILLNLRSFLFILQWGDVSPNAKIFPSVIGQHNHVYFIYLSSNIKKLFIYTLWR